MVRRRRPTKQEEKAAAAQAQAAAEAAIESAKADAATKTETDVKTEAEDKMETAEVTELGDGPNRPVRSTRGQNKKYDDGVSGSEDDDDAPLSTLKKKRKHSGMDSTVNLNLKKDFGQSVSS